MRAAHSQASFWYLLSLKATMRLPVVDGFAPAAAAAAEPQSHLRTARGDAVQADARHPAVRQGRALLGHRRPREGPADGVLDGALLVGSPYLMPTQNAAA
jgi:hypothetical protein